MLRLSGISKRFGAVEALSEVSFSIPDGAVTGFVGPNGAGKSTVMRIAMGLETADTGTVLVEADGADPTSGPTGRVGALLDASWVFGRRTALDHLWMLAATRGLPRSQALELLEFTGLASVAHRRVGTFSLGMRQRLGIAAALLGAPSALLLDEPVNGLDPEGVWWVRSLCRDLAARGVAVLVSSHLLGELAQTADRIVVIAGGRIRAEGNLADFLSGQEAHTVAAADDTARLAAECRAARADVVAAGSGRILVRGLTPVEVSRLATRAGLLLTHLEGGSVSLEERFVELTSDHVDYRAPVPRSPHIEHQEITR
jgi:ABC-2 type transport system ATP-binding protein